MKQRPFVQKVIITNRETDSEFLVNWNGDPLFTVAYELEQRGWGACPSGLPRQAPLRPGQAALEALRSSEAAKAELAEALRSLIDREEVPE